MRHSDLDLPVLLKASRDQIWVGIELMKRRSEDTGCILGNKCAKVDSFVCTSNAVVIDVAKYVVTRRVRHIYSLHNTRTEIKTLEKLVLSFFYPNLQ